MKKRERIDVTAEVLEKIVTALRTAYNERDGAELASEPLPADVVSLFFHDSEPHILRVACDGGRDYGDCADGDEWNGRRLDRLVVEFSPLDLVGTPRTTILDTEDIG